MAESKHRKEHIRMFFRFLKEEKLFKSFTEFAINEMKNRKFHEYLKQYNIRLPFFVVDCVGFDNTNRVNVIDLDNKWTIFLYENKLYGTSYTCSKRDLLNWLCDILIEAIGEKKYNEITDKVYQILINEKYGKKITCQYEKERI